jgi:hypothetical protein
MRSFWKQGVKVTLTLEAEWEEVEAYNSGCMYCCQRNQQPAWWPSEVLVGFQAENPMKGMKMGN